LLPLGLKGAIKAQSWPAGSAKSIAVAAAGGHLVGKESDLFRFTVKHSFIMLLFICLIVLAQAYLFEFLIPTYH